MAVSLSSNQQGGFLDALPLSYYQIWSVLMIAATVVLDGLDNQMLGLAAPSLIAEWDISRDTLGMVFALGFVGMAIGTLVSGVIGDLVGRRGALLIGVSLFGIATLLTGFSTALWQVAVLKFLAGAGLGGVPGTASAMIAEFTPARWRSQAVTFGVVCVSIGGVLGGLAAAAILPSLGWRWLFYLGGAITIAFVLYLLLVLPESPQYLLDSGKRRVEFEKVMTRIGHPDPASLKAEGAGGEVEKMPFSALFGAAHLRDTLALALAMFSGMFMIYLMFNWAPTMLTTSGYDLKLASLGLTSFNMGGVIGAMLASFAIIKLGSRITLVTMALVGTLVCTALAILPMGAGGNENAMLGLLVAMGLFASAAQSAMFAVGAHAFPTGVRARGLGTMGLSGRAGAIVSALAGAWLIGGGAQMFFGALAVLMLVNAIGFLIVQSHIPRLDRNQERPA
ncbi:MFS transporter [Croceicoccus mobilis]|uniref:MFS transporter n=1 Tax=Croceicoccus mobilis TaxID=1703339 RepID=A0A916Z780_9SPHN|nr:MFS transporter [Croceicoccus mobilis]GGD79855.1 MFS transporter [Croceicoccus mobilis]